MKPQPAAGAPRRLPVLDVPHPRYVVWELTLACDQRCTHCGSRAAEAREAELTTAEALAVIAQLRAAGTQEIALIGGEAYLHAGFLEIVGAVAAAGIRCSMTTGGRGVTTALASAMGQAGLSSVSVSIDGLQATHDLLRASRGGFTAALAAVGHLQAAGIAVGCNTVVNRLNLGELELLYDVVKGAGIRGWQIQLAAALGRAADRPAMLLQPWELLDLVPRIARLKARAYADGILLTPGNNVGYFSLDENFLRSIAPEGRSHWMGCQAGRASLGLESNGAVKGCPSLQTDTYVGGNVRTQPIGEIWETPQLAFTRRRSVDELWGFCRECPFADTCFGGCTFTAHAFFGRPGNNPYCHFRAKTLAARGQRERLVPKERAPGRPFDNGRFELVLEPFDAPDPKPARRESLLKIWAG